MVKSAYIHIPFCKSKCHYCSFVSFNKLDLKKDYIKALLKEIEFNYQGEVLNTLYFGGGTPSVLEYTDFAQVLRKLKTNSNTEITTEFNPEGVNYGYLRALYDLGINRISLGCQTFDDVLLKQINRRHNAGQVVDAVKVAQDVGFDNISLDFIYGLPNQTIESFLKDLKISCCIKFNTSASVCSITSFGKKFELLPTNPQEGQNNSNISSASISPAKALNRSLQCGHSRE